MKSQFDKSIDIKNERPEEVEKKLRQIESIHRQILMGILHKIEGIDIDKIKQDALKKGQDEGYQMAMKQIEDKKQ